VIRQAISCDICGTEKKQTNHWFVAYDQGGELRVSGWNSRNRLRPGSRHLCGQTCLHKLVDDFMARALVAQVKPSVENEAEVAELTAGTDTSLTSSAAFVEAESSARLISTSAAITPARPVLRMPVELVPMPSRVHAEEKAVPADEPHRVMRRATGVPKPGTGNGCAHCAPASGIRVCPSGAPDPDRGLQEGWTILSPDVIQAAPAARPRPAPEP
jgi:hypothetical protein